jgi:hypothetical protein
VSKASHLLLAEGLGSYAGKPGDWNPLVWGIGAVRAVSVRRHERDTTQARKQGDGGDRADNRGDEIRRNKTT